MTRIIPMTLLALLAGAPAAAQEHDHPPADRQAAHGDLATHEAMPDGWMMRLDRPGAGTDEADFQTMPPGWHVKTGRVGAGIFWMPEMHVTGPYTTRGTFHLFNPASHAEAFGLFVGGRELGSEGQEYLYFLVRQTGEYLIKRRAGAETTNVVGWTRHDAIPIAPPGEEGPTRYDLAVEVGAEDLEFKVNGTTVHSVPRNEVTTDGTAGLRINHMLDIHVEELAIDRSR